MKLTKLTLTQQVILQRLKYYKNCYNNSNGLQSFLKWVSAMKNDASYNRSKYQIRQDIRQLRKFGYPIIANNKGYCYTTKRKEVVEYVKSRRLELRDESITLNCMIRGVK